MADLSTIKRDVQAEIEGIRIEFDQVPGIFFVIARFQNPRYAKRIDELTAEIRGAWLTGDVPEEKVREILDLCASETLLVGWDGLEEADADGALHTVPYSNAKAYEILHDPAYIDVRNFVLWHSRQAEQYRVAARKKALGNSQGSSSGAQKTETTEASGLFSSAVN